MIRRATAEDVLPIVNMVEALRLAVGGPVPVDRAHTAQTLAALLSSPDASVWVSDGGFIAASLQRSVINPAPMAIEHGWWASDGSGLRLLRVYERWARERGAALVMLSTGCDGPDLTRVGYRHVEKSWIKDLA